MPLSSQTSKAGKQCGEQGSHGCPAVCTCSIGAAVAASSSGRYATSIAMPRNDCCGACDSTQQCKESANVMWLSDNGHKPCDRARVPDSERAHLHRSRQADAEVSQPMPHAVQLHAAAGLHESLVETVDCSQLRSLYCSSFATGHTCRQQTQPHSSQVHPCQPLPTLNIARPSRKPCMLVPACTTCREALRGATSRYSVSSQGEPGSAVARHMQCGAGRSLPAQAPQAHLDSRNSWSGSSLRDTRCSDTASPPATCAEGRSSAPRSATRRSAAACAVQRSAAAGKLPRHATASASAS